MVIPSEVVGSLPRSTRLQQAVIDYESDKITWESVEKIQDEECFDSISNLEKIGQPIISDGETRSPSFIAYPLLDTLGGKGLLPNLSPSGGQSFAIFADSHVRQLPLLISGPFRYKSYASSYVRKSKSMAKNALKQAVISPCMLSLLYPVDNPIPNYSYEHFLSDLVDECYKDIRQCFEEGASRVSIDFTEGRLACKNDPQIPWTCKNLLPEFVQLINRVLSRFTPEERKNIGIHACSGGDCDSTHSLDVDYSVFLPLLFLINAGYFLLQSCCEKDKNRFYGLCGKYSRGNQTLFIGVISTIDPRIEDPSEVCEELILASKYIDKSRLGATDNCGFSPFSNDKKPKHGNADHAREVAFKKIKARIEGAKMASEILKV